MKSIFKSRKRFYNTLSAFIALLCIAGAGQRAESQSYQNTPSQLSPPQTPICDSTSAGKIVFESTRDGNQGHYEIYSMNADGSNQTRLTNNDVTDDAPCLSRDGSKIVFCSEEKPGPEGSTNLYTMNADGTNRTRITDCDALGFQHAMEPQWSPDGKRIVFLSGYSEIYVVDADGSNLWRVVAATETAGNGEPEWNADGTQIVFQSARAGQNNIWKVNADGSQLQRLTSEAASDQQPSCSPDGQSIAFIREKSEDGGQVWIMKADGSGQKPLSRDTIKNAVHPTWSPDSRSVAFMHAQDRYWTIYRINVDSREEEKLTNSGRDNCPSWGQAFTPSGE